MRGVDRAGWYRRSGKRLFDGVAAAALLLLLAPLLAAVALVVRWKLGSPVLFRQRRPGLDGELFELLKFRSMAPASSPADTDATRLSPFGRALRRWSLDELPELVNVLRGEMSLVGPRPLLAHYLDLYDARQARRHEVRPGITGWAQIHGRNMLDWPERLEMDVVYVENLSFGLDLKILARTTAMMVRGTGIHAEGHATMPEFESGEEGTR